MRILFWRAVFESLVQWEGESCELGACVVEEARKGSSGLRTQRQLTQQLEHLFTPAGLGWPYVLMLTPEWSLKISSLA